MAWTPVVTTQLFNAFATSHPVNLPATIAAGDLLLLWASNHQTVTSGPGGSWVALDGPNTNWGLWALDCAGNEDGTTVDLVTGANAPMATAIVHIPAAEWRGTIADDIDIGTAAAGTSANPNPPSVTAGWVGEANLFIEFVAANDDGETVSAFSTNYTDGVTVATTGGTNQACSLGVAFRELTADSDDPGTMTLTGSEVWDAQTVVIRPAAAAGGATVAVPNAGAISLSANAPAVEAGASVEALAPSTVTLTAQAPEIVSGTKITVPASNEIAIQMLTPDVSAAVPPAPDASKTGVSLGEGVTFLESVRDGRMRVGRDGVMDDTE